MVNGIFLSAVEPLTPNMKDEQNMAEWIRTNSSGMMSQQWPKIQFAIANPHHRHRRPHQYSLSDKTASSPSCCHPGYNNGNY